MIDEIFTSYHGVLNKNIMAMKMEWMPYIIMQRAFFFTYYASVR